MSSTDNNKKKSTGPKLMVAGLLAGLLTLVSTPASATLVTLRADLGGTDYIDWGPLGGDGTQLTSSESVTSSLGVNATVSNSSGDLWTFVEGAGTFAGNFSTGDKLLSTFFTPGPIVIDFASGQSRVGAQIISNVYGPFNGVIAVYDMLDQLLESYSVGGVSSGDGDNSAIFIGVSRATADIGRVVFDVTDIIVDPNFDPDFTINRLALSSATTAVPVPAAAWLLLSGLGGLGFFGRRRAIR